MSLLWGCWCQEIDREKDQHSNHQIPRSGYCTLNDVLQACTGHRVCQNGQGADYSIFYGTFLHQSDWDDAQENKAGNFQVRRVLDQFSNVRCCSEKEQVHSSPKYPCTKQAKYCFPSTLPSWWLLRLLSNCPRWPWWQPSISSMAAGAGALGEVNMKTLFHRTTEGTRPGHKTKAGSDGSDGWHRGSGSIGHGSCSGEPQRLQFWFAASAEATPSTVPIEAPECQQQQQWGPICTSLNVFWGQAKKLSPFCSIGLLKECSKSLERSYAVYAVQSVWLFLWPCFVLRQQRSEENARIFYQ